MSVCWNSKNQSIEFELKFVPCFHDLPWFPPIKSKSEVFFPNETQSKKVPSNEKFICQTKFNLKLDFSRSQNDLSQPLVTESIDCSSGVLFPFYDHDTKIVFLAGKGDGNVR